MENERGEVEDDGIEKGKTKWTNGNNASFLVIVCISIVQFSCINFFFWIRWSNKQCKYRLIQLAIKNHFIFSVVSFAYYGVAVQQNFTSKKEWKSIKKNFNAQIMTKFCFLRNYNNKIKSIHNLLHIKSLPFSDNLVTIYDPVIRCFDDFQTDQTLNLEVKSSVSQVEFDISDRPELMTGTEIQKSVPFCIEGVIA